MSRPTTSPAPASADIAAAPTAPPAGPDSTVQEPWRAAVALSAMPPLESMISGTGSPSSRARSASRSR